MKVKYEGPCHGGVELTEQGLKAKPGDVVDVPAAAANELVASGEWTKPDKNDSPVGEEGGA
jgi:hypothetical protein